MHAQLKQWQEAYVDLQQFVDVCEANDPHNESLASVYYEIVGVRFYLLGGLANARI